jgi:hypothetical protein
MTPEGVAEGWILVVQHSKTYWTGCGFPLVALNGGADRAE